MHHYLIGSARDGRTRDGSMQCRGHWVLPRQTGLIGHVTGLTAYTGLTGRRDWLDRWRVDSRWQRRLPWERVRRHPIKLFRGSRCTSRIRLWKISVVFNTFALFQRRNLIIKPSKSLTSSYLRSRYFQIDHKRHLLD